MADLWSRIPLRHTKKNVFESFKLELCSNKNHLRKHDLVMISSSFLDDLIMILTYFDHILVEHQLSSIFHPGDSHPSRGRVLRLRLGRGALPRPPPAPPRSRRAGGRGAEAAGGTFWGTGGAGGTVATRWAQSFGVVFLCVFVDLFCLFFPFFFFCID